ncbi:(1-_4)-alpha-D-glucan 1-alpha-D-glucosylmutase [Actinomadura luteofluorescens]|uniref:(1->4)-alpha-D-glucan 1-alpha-D-glucosylmutase n=1 Tax=Actinomadura luteofluorescens TaxID=46163 RepID=A0A7Y9EKR8_9ACTN|nr:malto-oligosyltrehalose synthase [Actinomadura luteofluorescens]NYD49381.1 (1->4)-alpha-D-glucan 1-alpha-D-glucosylmutase [Actinomadura luteofluorescens]
MDDDTRPAAGTRMGGAPADGGMQAEPVPEEPLPVAEPPEETVSEDHRPERAETSERVDRGVPEEDALAAPPTGTYRLQLRGTPEGHFGFAEAAALAPYLAALGVSHVYLSPVLQAAPGSTHGYDVVDHSRLSEELGGPEAFGAMVTRFRAHGLRVLVDVVPNHMAIPEPAGLNLPFADVLAEGPRSRFARWFDIDWEAGGGRIVPPGEGEPNYRRFFDISGLIGLRQEDAEVFERTHALLLSLVRDGLVDGLRVDHPDGLADPRGYLRWLAEAAPDRWLLVEKITEGEERLPPDWPCAGTTGYDALGMIGGLFLDPAGEKPLTDYYVALTGNPASFEEVERDARAHAASHSLRPEVERLQRVLERVVGERRPGLERALVELLVAMPVYRAYVVPGEDAPQQAVDVVNEAARRARAHLPEEMHGDLDIVVDLALGRGERTDAEFIVRFQQTTSPLAAKGVEDTAFYRWNRMAVLNEVGGAPGRFSVAQEDFHSFCIRLARDWPLTMTTLSTHDTKREEDVRAWLAVLSELPTEWAESVDRWRNWGSGTSPLEPDLEYLFWQTLVGAWPLTIGRLEEFLTKAMREAKTRTSWAEQDPAYEEAVLDYARGVLADPDLVTDMTSFVAKLTPHARVNTLGQKLVQLAMPGVPDIYQGCEMTGLSLVDPDNRRPVDYGRRREHLFRLDTGRQPKEVDDEKLLLTSRALRLRRAHPEWFGPGSRHEPVAARGPAAEHVVGFARGEAVALATRLPVGLERRGGWKGTRVDVRRQGWRDVLTGCTHMGPILDASRVFEHLPVALLVPREIDR